MATQVQFEPWSHLDGKIVLVTGASSGLGREFCLDLARVGCRVIVAASVAVELDVTADARTIQMSVQRAWKAFGHIDALVNNAGIRGRVPSSLDLPEEWNATMRSGVAYSSSKPGMDSMTSVR
ncbi:hypothetical protein ACH5RR_003161 [Cinchona calisaya]|uniref:Uncharacterized protein n=1 Tax=Cinchona calisaya TaxID=153742 RepID=A0ABD3AU01_9GENT